MSAVGGPADAGPPAGELASLRRELERRDELLAAVYARADTLQRQVEYLEAQLDAAVQGQAELRRLLGNSQLQVHALLETPGGARLDDGEEPPSEQPTSVSAPAPPAAAGPESPPRPSVSRPPPPRELLRPRVALQEAREAWSAIRRALR